MAFEHFKPTLWSRQVTVNTDKQMVFPQVVNRQYESEIQYGKVLKINEVGDVDVNSYGSTGIAWQTVDDAQLEMVIDQKKYFAVNVDDVDKAQMNLDVMNDISQKAAFSIADEIDQFIAAKYSEAGITNATNLGSSTTGLNFYAADMPDLLTYMMRYLKEANATGRPWCVAPPWFMQLLRYAQITTGGGSTAYSARFNTPNSPALEGYGSGMGFDFYESNNVSNDGTDYRIMFGTRDAISFAGQLNEIEAVRREDYFRDGLRGLYIYGAKVVRPDHLGVVYGQFSGLST